MIGWKLLLLIVTHTHVFLVVVQCTTNAQGLYTTALHFLPFSPSGEKVLFPPTGGGAPTGLGCNEPALLVLAFSLLLP